MLIHNRKNPNFFWTLITCIVLLASCDSANDPKYLRWVGDSFFEQEIDDPSFELCSSEKQVRQHFHIGDGYQYKGEKLAVLEVFRKKYKAIETEQSGLIRIRFVVNCKGETGRFRMIQSDTKYQATTFDKKITDQLLSITKSLDGWEIKSPKMKDFDFYQYLVFKIDKGAIKEIMP